MAEPATSATAFAVTAFGLSVFGMATGLHPALLIVGLAGGLWAMFYGEPQPLLRRLASAVMSSLIAAWCAPAIAFGLPSLPIWPSSVPRDVIQFPVALIIGFLAMAVLGPGLMSLTRRKFEEASK